MKLGKWPLVAVAAVVVVGVVLRKRSNTGAPVTLQQEEESPEQIEARSILAKVYKLDDAELKHFLDHDAPIVELPQGLSDAVAKHRREEAPLTVERFVAWLEELAGASVFELSPKLSDGVKKLVLNNGYANGLLPAWAGQWWHNAVQGSDESSEPNFREFDELLAQHTKK
jgi:hypothetical protein